MKHVTRWECNNLDCDYYFIGEEFVTHPPDTDCPKCGYHDSVGVSAEINENDLLSIEDAVIANGDAEVCNRFLKLSNVLGDILK